MRKTREAKPKAQLSWRQWDICPRSPSLTADASLSPAELELYHHAQTCAIEDFGMGLLPTDFWNSHALPMSHTAEPIKHAICALAAAHRHFKSRRVNGGESPRSDSFETMCIVQYNRAISHINSITGDGVVPKAETVLICCVAFVCIENLLGRQAESLRHIRAGTELFSSLRRRTVLTGGPEKANNNKNSQLLNDIEDILATYSMHAAVYTGMDIAPDLYFCSAPESGTWNDTTQFKSIEDAAASLIRLKRRHVATMYMAKQTGAHSRPIHPAQSDNQFHFVPCDPGVNVVTGQAFEVWNKRFGNLEKRLQEKSTPKDDRYRILLLCLERAVWKSFSQMRGPDDIIEPEACSGIQDEAELVIGWHKREASPAFSFSSNIIIALAMSCVLSTDKHVQKRGTALLRSLHRREGMWDSDEAADVIEALARDPTKKQQSWWSVPWKQQGGQRA